MADAPPVASPPTDGMPAGWPRRLAVATITIGLMMSVLSNSMTNLALPYIAQDLEHHRRKLDLDRQRHPDRPDHLAAAGGGVGRHRGLPPRLPLRPGPVLAGLDRLRAGAVAALAAGGPHLPGPGRCRHHGGPARPGARHLSALPARPRARLQHHRGRHLAGRRSLDRRPRSVDGLLADTCSPSTHRSASSPSSWPNATCRTPRTPIGRST